MNLANVLTPVLERFGYSFCHSLLPLCGFPIRLCDAVLVQPSLKLGQRQPEFVCAVQTHPCAPAQAFWQLNEK